MLHTDYQFKDIYIVHIILVSIVHIILVSN